MIRYTTRDKQYNTHNTYVQSIGITTTAIGYGIWEYQDETKQAIYVCTRYTSQSIKNKR